jgi:hypothetical protein
MDSKRDAVAGGLLVIVVLGAVVGTWSLTHQENVGQRIRRECEQIATQVAQVYKGSSPATVYNNAVAECLMASASRGRS